MKKDALISCAVLLAGLIDDFSLKCLLWTCLYKIQKHRMFTTKPENSVRIKKMYMRQWITMRFYFLLSNDCLICCCTYFTDLCQIQEMWAVVMTSLQGDCTGCPTQIDCNHSQTYWQRFANRCCVTYECQHIVVGLSQAVPVSASRLKRVFLQ